MRELAHKRRISAIASVNAMGSLHETGIARFVGIHVWPVVSLIWPF